MAVTSVEEFCIYRLHLRNEVYIYLIFSIRRSEKLEVGIEWKGIQQIVFSVMHLCVITMCALHF